ncbi:GNAT family N-acetyltransferase [Mycolicibacterium llatzerense]|uniref:GNAT family N-acetyltransferase n=1 Tax=Mycolicibacterium llatzerense TaxID=280871 RepID=UPI0021B5C153|nr:GNAT family N-acetyltransferase [Mycolicibacterium llatzerense]MCT7366332.1 GCN5 family acetyltransferase [Mycolicibacterium llatzerense]
MTISIRPLREDDLATADHIARIAFGTFVGLPEPETFMGDADYVRTRWRTEPSGAFAAEYSGEVVGSNFATHWGSVGFFGPLTIRPDLWDRGIGRLLLEPIIDCFDRWQTTHTGLFTFAESPKHVGLYQRFGFWPRFLTAVMSKTVDPNRTAPTAIRFSELTAAEQDSAVAECRELTSELFDGLDLTTEIRAVADQGLGETVLLWDDASLAGVAVCHYGAGTEAGSGTCYIKFGAARPGPGAETAFFQLLDAVESLSATNGLARIAAGVNTARHEAYSGMLARGFRTDIQGVAMHRPNSDGYSRPGAFVIDDWR